jgi:hypothetical protein
MFLIHKTVTLWFFAKDGNNFIHTSIKHSKHLHCNIYNNGYYIQHLQYIIYYNYFPTSSTVSFILSTKHLILTYIHLRSKPLWNTTRISASQIVSDIMYTRQSDRITFAALLLAVLTYQQNSHITTSQPIPIEFEVNILKQIVLPAATPGRFISNKYSNMTLFRYENN